jgi:hypothetical protein
MTQWHLRGLGLFAMGQFNSLFISHTYARMIHTTNARSVKNYLRKEWKEEGL